jgi:metal-responsive CopG/Arc/MetJ family transcriptional regulator
MKNKRKVKVFFTIDPDLYTEFEKHIDDKLLDKSKLIEFLIKEYMESKKS